MVEGGNEETSQERDHVRVRREAESTSRRFSQLGDWISSLRQIRSEDSSRNPLPESVLERMI